MADNPYGIDYLKNLVSTSLGGKNQGGAASEDDEDNESGSQGEGMYGIPAPQQNTELATPPPGASMGPRFAQAVQQGGLGSVASAAGPVASAALSGGSSIMPGAPQMAQGVADWAKPSGSRGDFSDAPPPSNIHEYLSRLAHFESGRNPSAYNKSSSASGMFQYTDPTWNKYQGYQSAKDAPPAVQYQRALEDTVGRLKSNDGDVAKATLTHFLGAQGMKKVLENPQKLYEPVNAANGDTTPMSYLKGIIGSKAAQDWAMNHHTVMGDQAADAKQIYNLPAQG